MHAIDVYTWCKLSGCKLAFVDQNNPIKPGVSVVRPVSLGLYNISLEVTADHQTRCKGISLFYSVHDNYRSRRFGPGQIGPAIQVPEHLGIGQIGTGRLGPALLTETKWYLIQNNSAYKVTQN